MSAIEQNSQRRIQKLQMFETSWKWIRSHIQFAISQQTRVIYIFSGGVCVRKHYFSEKVDNSIISQGIVFLFFLRTMSRLLTTLGNHRNEFHMEFQWEMTLQLRTWNSISATSRAGSSEHVTVVLESSFVKIWWNK